MSVTKTGGKPAEKTIELTARLKHEVGVEAMSHMTCATAGRTEMNRIFELIRDAGIENVLPLRGDPPADQPGFVRPPDGFGYANELVRFIRERDFPFCLAGAAYPEKHQEAPSPEIDLANLKAKVDAGVDFLITQMFYRNADYFAFVERARARRHHGADRRRHHADHQRSPRSSASRRCRAPPSLPTCRPTSIARATTRRAAREVGIAYAIRAVPRAARARRPRHSFLHAESVAGDVGDPARPPPRSRVTARNVHHVGLTLPASATRDTPRCPHHGS